MNSDSSRIPIVCSGWGRVLRNSESKRELGATSLRGSRSTRAGWGSLQASSATSVHLPAGEVWQGFRLPSILGWGVGDYCSTPQVSQLHGRHIHVPEKVNLTIKRCRKSLNMKCLGGYRKGLGGAHLSKGPKDRTEQGALETLRTQGPIARFCK